MPTIKNRFSLGTRLSFIAILLFVLLAVLARHFYSEDKKRDATLSEQYTQTKTSNISSAVVAASTDATSVTATKVEPFKKTAEPEPAQVDIYETSDGNNIDALESTRLNSFTDSITEGDSRTPPLVRQEPDEQPSQNDLDDPDKYLAFQARQKQKVFISYIRAAKTKLNNLRNLVAEGEKRGISEEQLLEGKTKIRKIEEMVEQIKTDNPELDN